MLDKLATLAARKWPIPVIMALVFGLAATGVLAATGQITPVSHSATGVAAGPGPGPSLTYTFSLFEADGTTALALPIQWGDVVVGTPKTKTITVKSTGTGAVSVTMDTANVPAGWTITAPDVTALAPGASANMTLTLATTATGAVNFTTDFKAVY